MLQGQEVTPESDDISTVSSRDNITVMTTRGRILGRSAALQRIGNQQDRWKRQVKILYFIESSIIIIFLLQVQEQRRHIYDQHTMLN